MASTDRSPATGAQSVVTLTNTHRFSYPGYSEILTGEAHDDVIKSNDRVQNPYPTVLEESEGAKLSCRPPAWRRSARGTCSTRSSSTRGAITVNAGYEPFETSDTAGME